MRTLEEIANATPSDYSSHAPLNPAQTAHQMFAKASNLFPKPKWGDGDTAYRFLFVGPGAGHVVKELIDLEQQARGIETSKRGIITASQDIWSYIIWSAPWEVSLQNKSFDICLVNRYLKAILLPDEWSSTVKEMKRLSNYQALI